MPREERHQPDSVPDRLGRYRIVRAISTGGMARVYEARREAIEGVAPRVALKVILPDHAHDEAYRQLFINEARIGSMLRHQNLCEVRDFDANDAGLFFLVMEYVEGVTLRQAIRQARRQGALIPLSIIAEIGRQVCDGLHHAHSAQSPEGRHLQLVHRDLKPSNLMLNPQGVVKLLDFGISKALIATERPGAVRGTWGYMSPEQAAGEPVGAPADLFGLAAVLYELAALQPLFREKDPEAVRALLAQDEAARRASKLSGQHAALAGVLIRALQRDPQARYPSAAALGRALGGLARDPLVAREQLVRFQRFVVATRSGNNVERRSSSTIDSHPQQPESGLPLRVGDVHRPAPPSEPPRPAGEGAVQQLQAILFALFIGASVGTIGFTAWKVLSQRPASIFAPAPEPEPVEILPPPLPVEAPAPAPEPAEEPAVIELGLLSVDAQPAAQVLIDGEPAGATPLQEHRLPVGDHTVTLVAATGERTSFTVGVLSEVPVRRVWSFELGEWLPP